MIDESQSEVDQSEIDNLNLLIKLAGLNAYISYTPRTYTRGYVYASNRRWRLLWFKSKVDAYNGYARHRGSYSSFEGLRKKVLRLIELQN